MAMLILWPRTGWNWTNKLNTYNSCLEGHNYVSLLIGNLQLVALSNMSGLVGVRAPHAGLGQHGGQQAGQGECGVTTGEVARLMERLRGVAGACMDTGLSKVEDGIR